MCGIVCYLNPEQDLASLNTEFQKGRNRGPEFSCIKELDPHTVVGFHRLAINGLTPQSNQPFQIDNMTLVCNGEIYNYRKLYQLCNAEPTTHSDCEIILHLYKKYGILQTLELLDGEFAFVLIDGDRLYAARDPYGVRPLYWYSNEHSIGFASEIKTLIGVHPDTIEHVVPGTYISCSLDINVGWSRVSVDESRAYFSPRHPTTFLRFENYSKALYDSLVQAVKKRVENTERPVACLLSGGLDSSLVAAIAASMVEVETYSIGLEGSEDLMYAQIVADHIGSKHTQILLTERDFCRAIPEVVRAIESYDTTTVRASIGNYLIGKHIAANSKCKVVLNGDGSDEVAGGYLYMQSCPDALEFDKETRRLLREIHAFDVLRSDKSISSHGLEPRTPFLDRDFVDTYLSIPPQIRFHVNQDEMEKYLIRRAFADSGLLPKEVLWRKKEAFSDGVSKHARSLYLILQEYADSFSFDAHCLARQVMHCPPKTKEQLYYRQLFEEAYPGQGNVVPHFWMPKYVTATDASARTLSEYQKSHATV